MKKENNSDKGILNKIKNTPEIKSVTTDIKNMKKKISGLKMFTVKNLKKEVRYIDSAEYINEEKYTKLKKLLFQISELFFVVFILAFVFHFFHFGVVSGNSMEPTYHSGDKWITILQKEYCQNDVVIFYQEADGEKEVMIKRIIATEGDTIMLLDGNLYVNDELYLEEYTQGETNDLEETVVGENEIFVMGDNRENSYDSRYFGTVNCDDVIGKVVIAW